ncbi:hypothetical protein CWC16_08855 [Pseudoalteromonas sp. S3776]|uniref:hypothetical protein n=1 Tax=Pseudoalteromonas sp. S3776 TaxID=579544 RepID=UPI001107DF01|nr:hypothetical protein [Pseudoalteromonas sp. S3776]TMO80274.1 hypothetical protein CWC16_08855 [Pseudoalteromonas sp. S3776]
MDKQSRMELRRKAGYRDLPKPQVKVQSPVYSMSFACCNFKTSNMRQFNLAPCDYPRTIECPVCKGVAVNLGRHFKPPKNSDTAQWKKVEYLIEHGFVFQKIRTIKNSFDSVPYPETLAQAKEFVIKYQQYAAEPPHIKSLKQDK